jgi:predicted component of type VI protein secretion system
MGLPERAREGTSQPGARVLKIRLSLKGRPIRSYRFKQETVTVGRDPDSDVFLDNPGVSRQHLTLHGTPRGYYEVEDLGSANGTILNDKAIQGKREVLMENDVLHIGKFSLWVSYEVERRGHHDADTRQMTPTAFQGTTVLSTMELQSLVSEYRERGDSGMSPPAAAPEVRTGFSHAAVALLLVISFLAGVLMGGAGMWFLGRG